MHAMAVKKTFPACQKTQWERTTLGIGKKYYVNMNWYLHICQCSKISVISWFSVELLLEISNLLATIVQLVKLFLCIFKLCTACPPHLLLCNFLDSSWVDNFLNFPKLFLILIDVLRLILPLEWFQKYSVNWVVSSHTLRNLVWISMGANNFMIL